MMYLILFLILSSGSVIGSTFLKKRYEEMLPLTVFSIMLIMFIFFLFNKLVFGLYFIYLLCTFLYLFSIYYIIKNADKRKDILKRFFSPGFLIFILSAITIFIITKDFFVALCDELRLWAAYPKALYYYNDTDLYHVLGNMQGRIPGMPVFMYFITKTLGVFKDSILFLSYGIVSLSIFLPLAKKVTWKKWYLVILLSILFIFFPLAFANNNFDYISYYRTLFIDPILGLIFGYSIYLVYKGFKEKTDYITFIVVICSMCLIKEIGMMLSLISAILFMYFSIINRKKEKRNKKVLKKSLICLLSVLIISIGWFIFKSTLNEATSVLENSLSTTLQTVYNFIISPNIKQRFILNEFVNQIFNNSVLLIRINNYGITLLPLLLIFTMYIGAIYFLSDRDKKILGASISLYIALISTLLMHLLVYLFVIERVDCYPRYIGTIISAISVFILFVLIDKSNLDYKKRKEFTILLILYLTLISIFCPIKLPKLIYESTFKTVIDVAIQSGKEVSSFSLEENSKILMVHKGKNHELMASLLSYELIQYKLIADENHIYSIGVSDKSKLEESLKTYNPEYVFFYSIVYSQSTELYDYVDKLEKNRIYKVIKEKNKYKFVLVN